MRSLLADIRAAGRERVRPRPPNDAARIVRDDVLANLREICATPRGTVPLGGDYGIEDATRIFHEYPGSVTEMQRDLEETFAKYEPRLRNVSVTHVPSSELELVLRFHIEGTLVVDGRTVPVRFTSVLHADSRIDLD
jgi:type VI secretion system protein